MNPIRTQLNCYNLAENVKRPLEELSMKIGSDFAGLQLRAFENCEISSPVEQIFYMYWNFYQSIYCRPIFIFLSPQYKIENYRVDFFVDLPHYFKMNTNCILSENPNSNYNLLIQEIPKYVIEIDGHWHEKTPEQVEQDKQRERLIQMSGFKMFRFTGKEIVNQPLEVISNFYEYVRAQVSDLETKYNKLGGW